MTTPFQPAQPKHPEGQHEWSVCEKTEKETISACPCGASKSVRQSARMRVTEIIFEPTDPQAHLCGSCHQPMKLCIHCFSTLQSSGLHNQRHMVCKTCCSAGGGPCGHATAFASGHYGEHPVMEDM